MVTRYQIISERDNRVVVGPVKKTVAESELKRLRKEAKAQAPAALNMPTEAEAEADPNAAAIRGMLLENGPAAAESFRLEEIELEHDLPKAEED